MEFKSRPSGILVPAHPTFRNVKAPAEFKPDSRKYTGEVGRRIVPPTPADLRHLREHVHGRAEAAAQVAAALAYLKSRGRLREIEIVTATGAVYQDAKGTKVYPRAHRFPCNIMIGYSNVPELPSFSDARLSNALKVPYAITDPLPVIANYSDRFFETAGAVEAVVYAVRFIATEQKKGKPVHVNLVRHVIEMILLAGFEKAYEEARANVRERGGAGLANLAKEGTSSHLTEGKLTEMEEQLAQMEGDPSENLHIVDQLLAAEAAEAKPYLPRMGRHDQIIAQEALLDAVSENSGGQGGSE